MIQGMISAWITTEFGAALPEFNVKHAEGRVDCWIPSIQGSNFCINWHSINPSTFGLRGDIWLDGVAVGGGLLLPNETRGIKMTGHSTGNTTERPYHFGKLQLTDDENLSNPDDPRLTELNTIRLVLDWVQVTEERQFYQTNAPPQLGPIHEMAAKKAHGDSAGLGALRPSTARQWYNTRSIGMKKTVLVFHYAPQDWLLAKKIITAPITIKAEPNAISSHQYLATHDREKKRGPGRSLIDWFGPSSSPSTAGPSRAVLPRTPSGSSRQFQASTSTGSSSRKRAHRSTSPSQLNIYDSDDDDIVEQILTSPAKRLRTEAKAEPSEQPTSSFVNGEVIDLTGDDSD